MEGLVLKIIYTIFTLINFIIRIPHERRNKANLIVDDQKNVQERVLLLLVFIGMMIFPLAYVFTNLFGFANYQVPLLLQVMGILAMATSSWLFYRSHRDLGRNWSVSLEIREEHTLVSTGVYSKIRHPMYTAIWLWAIGQALLLHNYIAGLGGMLFFGLMYFLRVLEEERMMEDNFGDAYRDYKKQTGRLLPKF